MHACNLRGAIDVAPATDLNVDFHALYTSNFLRPYITHPITTINLPQHKYNPLRSTLHKINLANYENIDYNRTEFLIPKESTTKTKKSQKCLPQSSLIATSTRISTQTRWRMRAETSRMSRVWSIIDRFCRVRLRRGSKYTHSTMSSSTLSTGTLPLPDKFPRTFANLNTRQGTTILCLSFGHDHVSLHSKAERFEKQASWKVCSILHNFQTPLVQ